MTIDARAIVGGLADMRRVLAELVTVTSGDEVWELAIRGGSLRAVAKGSGAVQEYGRPSDAVPCKLNCVFVVRNGAGHLRYVSCEDLTV
jgi:hypothetical protein